MHMAPQGPGAPIHSGMVNCSLWKTGLVGATGATGQTGSAGSTGSTGHKGLSDLHDKTYGSHLPTLGAEFHKTHYPDTGTGVGGKHDHHHTGGVGLLGEHDGSILGDCSSAGSVRTGADESENRGGASRRSPHQKSRTSKECPGLFIFGTAASSSPNGNSNACE